MCTDISRANFTGIHLNPITGTGQCDMALAGGFTFRMEDQRSYESHGDGLQSEDGLIHTFDVQASSSGLGMVLLDTLTGSGLHPASRAFLRPGA